MGAFFKDASSSAKALSSSAWACGGEATSNQIGPFQLLGHAGQVPRTNRKHQKMSKSVVGISWGSLVSNLVSVCHLFHRCWHMSSTLEAPGSVALHAPIHRLVVQLERPCQVLRTVILTFIGYGTGQNLTLWGDLSSKWWKWEVLLEAYWIFIGVFDPNRPVTCRTLWSPPVLTCSPRFLCNVPGLLSENT